MRRYEMRRQITSVLFLVALLLAACGDGSSGTSTSAVPYGLDQPSWPKDASSLQDVFDRLPDTLDGVPRTDAPWLTATYGEDAKRPEVTVFAVDLGGAECPGLTGASLVLSTLEEGGSVTVAERSSDSAPEGSPAFIVGSRKDGTSVAGWSVPGCHWVFAVEGATSELRDAAIGAVVQAARAS